MMAPFWRERVTLRVAHNLMKYIFGAGGLPSENQLSGKRRGKGDKEEKQKAKVKGKKREKKIQAPKKRNENA